MSDTRQTPRGIAVPGTRLSRLSRLGGMALGVAGNVAFHGGREWLSGSSPRVDRLVLTPANLGRITRELSRMRGAAMKMGQLLSMEGDDFLPPEMAEILARLRNDADFMPPRQLKTVLIRHWGQDFMKRFDRFDVRPIAAASIGQVHRARTRDGHDLAIKVQYPGVRRSIDSDVANVALLLRMSRLLPRELDIEPLLGEARRQLHEEADYAREGLMMARFGELLSDDPDLLVPELHNDLTTDSILAMSYMPGRSVDQLSSAPQDIRDHVVSRLILLMMQEIFEYGLMQTDPNFANYAWDADSGQIVLMDFGASRSIPAQLTGQYRGLFRAGLDGDRDAVLSCLETIGFLATDTRPHHAEAIWNMFDMAMAPLRSGGVFDFGQSDLIGRLRQAGMDFAAQGDYWVIPPADALFLQRKVGGMYLLATRLRARVDLDRVLAPVLRAGTFATECRDGDPV
ncbi:AarF/ABC1/UbiB kinase family protein [uncultured Roseobacter sp.]|uniref:ABC1 kinase family protein n=1 Tax=uncultured Roseobacter sp. TaxID=114847 RepID=UPI002632DEFE|nr:AarF/ABC1/UbiB kinase family protein [uncultured Roseobacter sp.]